MTRRRVGRWGVGLLGTLALTGLGVLFADPVVLTGAAVPLVYVLYGALSGVRAADLSARRSFDSRRPAPGDAVGVTLTVENTGDAVLPDVRVVDGVPDELAVTGGSPRACAALAPGETATLTYDLVAKRGEYDFSDPVVRLRSLAASERVTVDLASGGATTLSCVEPAADSPPREATSARVGSVPSDSGGSGLAFHATREYQHGDPMNRVDWRHYARTGEFVTVEYREERLARTVLVVDARPVVRVTPRPGYPTGGELCVYAAERLREGLARAGVETTVTAVGVADHDVGGLVGPDGLPWVDADGRPARAATLFAGLRRVARAGAGRVGATPPAASTAAGVDGTTGRLLARLSPGTRVVVCTPLLDNWPVGFVRSLARRGVPRTAVSPDVAGGDTPGQRLTALDRDCRLRAIERAGATAVDWSLERPVDRALRRSLGHLLSNP